MPLVCLAIAAPSAAADWQRLDSPNFVVVGDVSGRELRNTAARFEAFRETLGRIFNAGATSAVPTVVIVFSSDRAFTPFKPRYNGRPVELSGVSVGQQDVNFIAIVAAADENAMRVVFHEYTHLVVSNLVRNPPVWLNEGLAEYFGTYRAHDDGRRGAFGSAIPSHLQQLKSTARLSLETLLTVDQDSPLYNEGERRSIFYAQSWALTHLILSPPDRLTQLTAFLAAVDGGSPPMIAWRQAFGEGMDRALDQYVGRRVFDERRFEFPDKIASFEGQSVPLPAADVQSFLAEFLLGQGRNDEAAERLSAAVKLDPSNQRAAAVLAHLDAARGAVDAAARRTANLQHVDDWLVAYTAGTAVASRLDRQLARAQPEDAAEAQRFFDQVRRQHGDVPNALARLVSIELRSAEGFSADALSAIERARSLAPGRYDYAFLHAQVLARKGDFKTARALVGPLMTPAYPQGVRESARSLMRRLVEAEADSTRRSALPAGRPDPAVVSSSTGPSRARTSETVLVPQFRRLGEGEQRIEGQLELIDCSGVSVFFQVRTANGPVVARAARMADVEFITYRTDLKGSVACAPLKEPIPIYLTWREGTPAGAKLAVALEFLPN